MTGPHQRDRDPIRRKARLDDAVTPVLPKCDRRSSETLVKEQDVRLYVPERLFNDDEILIFSILPSDCHDARSHIAQPAKCD